MVGAKTFCLLLGLLPKVSRCKSGTGVKITTLVEDSRIIRDHHIERWKKGAVING
jgi:hypothetical protein